MSTTQRYAGIANSVQEAGQAAIDREDLKVGRLVRGLKARCAESLVDATVTILAGGRVHVQLIGVDWELKIRRRSDDIADAVDQALDDLNRRRGERQ